MHRRAAGIAAVLVLVTAGTATAARPRGGAGTVSADGAVGQLRIDRSTVAQIKAFAGRPAYVGAGALRPLIHEFAPFTALGYECTHVSAGGIPTLAYDKTTGTPRDSHVACRTVYFVNRRTGRLAGFTTGSRGFATARGVRPGTTVVEAKRRERHYYVSEVPPALNERTAAAWLSLDESIVESLHGWRPGTTVATLTLESRRHPIGLQFA